MSGISITVWESSVGLLLRNVPEMTTTLHSLCYLPCRYCKYLLCTTNGTFIEVGRKIESFLLNIAKKRIFVDLFNIKWNNL